MRIFVDTSAWIALFDQDDQHHPEATRLLQDVKRQKIRLVTSDYVFDESLTAVSIHAGPKVAREVGEYLLGSRIVEFVWLDMRIKKAAWELFKRNTQQKVSFTDCTSFVLMKKEKITTVFTFDEHFLTVGFHRFTVQEDLFG